MKKITWTNEKRKVDELLPADYNPRAMTDKEKKQDSDELVTVMDGTTNEDVLDMLIDRIEMLNQHMSSKYNETAINHLKEALKSLNERTAERVSKGIEGTAKSE